MEFPRSLRVSVLPRNGLFEVLTHGDGKVDITGGLEAEYVEILSKSLDFDARILVPEDGEWGRKVQNDSWTGLVGMVLRNETDLAIGEIAVTEERHRIIHYSSPYRYTHLTFATNEPSKRSKFTSFLYPFTIELWITLAVLIIVMPFVFKMLLTRKISLKRCFSYTLKSLLGEPLTISSNCTAGDYYLIGAWQITSMFILFSYSCTLLSFLTAPLNEPGLKNIKQLSELVLQGKFRCGCFKGTNVLNILRRSQYKSIMDLANHIETNHYDIETEKANVEKFFKVKHSAMILTSIYFQMYFSNVLRLSPEPIKHTAVSIIASKTFCCKHKLDSYINRMFDSGLSQQIVDRVLTRIEIKTAFSRTYSAPELSLNLEDTMGAFILLISGMILSTAVFVLEIIVSKLKQM